MKKLITVYWLIPAEPYRKLFREIIRILAHEFDAPRFEPHLTLCLAQDRQLRQLKAKTVRLRLKGIATSSKFTKTLFVRFGPNRALPKLIVDLGGMAKSLRDPHLSLIYQNLPVATRRQLARMIKLPFPEVVFDSIQAVRVSIPIKKAADIKSWRMMAKKSLND